jgi:hypothetical protein
MSIQSGKSKFLIILAAGLIVAYPAACRWFEIFQKPLADKALVLLPSWLIISTLIWLFDRKYYLLVKIVTPIKLKKVFWSLVASAAILIIFGWQPPAFPSTFDIKIVPSRNVTVFNPLSGGLIFDLYHFSKEGKWEISDDRLSNTGIGQASLTYNGVADAPLELSFQTGANEGSVDVHLSGDSASLNLTTVMPDALVYRPFLASMGNPTPLYIILVGLLFVTEWLLLSTAALICCTLWLSGTIALLFPMVFLLPYVTTISGHNVTIGNDFGPFYYVYKAYLLDFLSNGQFPLWSPSEAAGYTFFSNPLAQTMYPPNLILAIIYKINQGYTRLDHQVFTVAAICWFSLGLYLWLRSLNLEKRYALFSALTLALSYKMVELLRFPNAAHEAAWYPWILLGLTRLFTSSDKKTTLRWSFVLFGSLVCLFTAGYPYYIYYLPFLIGPFLLMMLIPRVRMVMFGVDKPRWREFLVPFATASMLALLVCAPYLYQMGRTINQTSGRAGDDFTHATMYQFDFQDTVESLIYPPGAYQEGWFYFGALGVVLIGLYAARPARNGVEDSKDSLAIYRSMPVKAALFGWLVFLSYISYGERSYLFLLLYEIMPGFSALRGWARLSIALLPGLSLLLAYSIRDFEGRIQSSSTNVRKASLFTWTAMGIMTVSTLAYQLYAFFKPIKDGFWDYFLIRRMEYLIQTVTNTHGVYLHPDPASLSKWMSFAYIIFSLLASLFVSFYLSRKKTNDFTVNRIQFYVVLGIFTTVNLWFAGPWLWNNGFSTREIREPGGYQRMLASSFSVPRKNEDSTLTLSPSFSVGSPPKWHFGRYQEFYFGAANEPQARDRLLGVINGQRFFFSKSIQYETLADYLEDAGQFDIQPVIHDYTGDYLLVELTSPERGYLTFVDNWDADWRASIDGTPANLYALFGVFKSVELSPGRHEIRLAYCPQFFAVVNPACSLVAVP